MTIDCATVAVNLGGIPQAYEFSRFKIFEKPELLNFVVILETTPLCVDEREGVIWDETTV